MAIFETCVHDYFFPSNLTPPLTASPDSGVWRKADTSAAGAPTLVGTAGLMVGSLEATSEVQNLCLYHGDQLAYLIDYLLLVEFWIKCSAAFTAADSLSFGMGSGRNDVIDSLTNHASFRLIGSNEVYCETDDAVNDVDDKDTGQTLVAAVKKFAIDFGSGIQSVSPPGVTKGGKANVKFLMNDPQGSLRRVCENTLFDTSNTALGLQPYVQLQKTAGTTVPTFSLWRCRITFKQPY